MNTFEDLEILTDMWQMLFKNCYWRMKICAAYDEKYFQENL